MNGIRGNCIQASLNSVHVDRLLAYFCVTMVTEETAAGHSPPPLPAVFIFISDSAYPPVVNV